MIKYIKINMRLILNIIGVKVLGGCYPLNRGMSRRVMRMEGTGRVGMKMLMMRAGMGMINTINNIMGKHRGKASMGSLLDKDKDRGRGMVGSMEVLFRRLIWLDDMFICTNDLLPW
jgi:hypothetical protein